MDVELHQYHKGHEHLDTAIQDLLLKLYAEQKEAAYESEREKEMRMVLHRIQNNLHSLSKVIDDPLKSKVRVQITDLKIFFSSLSRNWT